MHARARQNARLGNGSALHGNNTARQRSTMSAHALTRTAGDPNSVVLVLQMLKLPDPSIRLPNQSLASSEPLKLTRMAPAVAVTKNSVSVS